MLEFIFDRIFFLSLSGSAALLLIMSVIFLFRRHISAKLKYRLLLLPIILFLVPVSFSLPRQTAPEAEKPETTAAPLTDSDVINITQSAEIVTDAPQKAAPAQPAKPKAEAPASPAPFFDFSIVINSAARLFPFLWLFGLSAAVFLKALSIVRFKRGLRKIEASRSGNIIYFDGKSTPFVSGILRPKIYMPMSLDEREENLILLHENTHIRRGDLIVKAVAELITVFHFYNPFAYILRHIINEYMELSCDEDVTKNMDVSDCKEYGMILLTTIKKQKLCPSSAACLAENRRITKRRIELIMRPKKKSILKTFLSAFLVLAVTGGSVTLASAITSQSTAKAPKATYVDDSVYNISVDNLVDDKSSQNFISEGGVATYSDMLGKTKFSLSFYAMPQSKVDEIEKLFDAEKTDEAFTYYDDLDNYSDYYEINLTKVTRKYGGGHYLTGLFTMTKNGDVYFENQTGYLGALPPDDSVSAYTDATRIIIPFEKDSESYVLSTYLSFETSTYEETLRKRTAEKEFTLSRDTKRVRLGNFIEASVDGKAIDVSELNQYLTDEPYRPEWRNYLNTLTYNPRLNEASAYFDLGDYILNFSRGEKADCGEGTVKADFRFISDLIENTYYSFVTDVIPVTVTGLDNEPGGFIEAKSDDGRIYIKQEIVPYIEEPLAVYGTREPEEFYTEGEEVLIGTPREQDDYDIENPDKPIKRIIVDNNRKVLAVVPLQYQVGFLEKEEDRPYRQAATWEELFTDSGIRYHVIGNSDEEEKDEYLLRYDMASWWIKAIIPSDCIYFKSYE